MAHRSIGMDVTESRLEKRQWLAVAEKRHDAEDSLEQTERNGACAMKSGSSGRGDAREVVACGYVFNPLQCAGLPNAPGKAFTELELDALAQGLKLQILR